MIQQMILLALEFSEVAVMRRPDHKFRGSVEKGRLCPTTSFYIVPFFAFRAIFTHYWQSFLSYTYIFLRKICICICLSLYFLSVLTFASFFPSLDGLRPITLVLQDLITRESTEEEFFFTQSTTYRSDETK